MQRVVDRAGQVERFRRRVEQAEELRKEIQMREEEKRRRERERLLIEIVDEEDVEAIDTGADE